MPRAFPGEFLFEEMLGLDRDETAGFLEHEIGRREWSGQSGGRCE